MFGIEYVDWIGVGPGRIKWNKMVADGSSFKKYELAYCSSIDYTREIKLLHSGMMQAKSIAEPTVMQGNKKLNEKKIHNTQKPILLYDILYRDFIPQGSIVLDPNLGSGSNRISARKWGVHFIGCEIDPIMHAAEQKRFTQYISQTRLLIF
jgi:site-specific DNA-methyltransferase (adenine-specific)